MPHLFDTFTQELARYTLAGLVGRIPTPARTENRGPCKVILSEGGTTYSYTVRDKFDGKPLSLDVTETFARSFGGPSPVPPAVGPDASQHLPFTAGMPAGIGLTQRPKIATSQTVSFGNDAVLHLDSASFNGSTQYKVSYGPAIQGIRQGSFTTDGQTLQGVIDGRPIVPRPAAPNGAPLQFVDGGPAPVITLDPALHQAISGLLSHAGQVVSSCTALPQNQPPLATPIPAIVGGDQCDQCTSSCDRDSAICYAGAIAACIASFGFACGGIALCGAAYNFCLEDCDSPGHACCPVGCPGGNCCNTGETCTDQNVDPRICCPAGQVVCAGICCAPGSECNQNVCCPSNRTVCSGACCAPGAVCSNEGVCCQPPAPGVTPLSCHGFCCGQGEVCRPEGICCSPGTPVCASLGLGPVCCHGGACDDNGFCCDPGTGHFCPGSNVCCGFGICCGSECCGVGDVCLSNRDGVVGCCPPSRACGQGGDNPVCCPQGQMCIDQQNSTCASCPDGQTPCTDQNGNVLCCPPNVACCNGSCCSPGLFCCRSIVTGQISCNPMEQCVVPR